MRCRTFVGISDGRHKLQDGASSRFDIGRGNAGGMRGEAPTFHGRKDDEIRRLALALPGADNMLHNPPHVTGAPGDVKHPGSKHTGSGLASSAILHTPQLCLSMLSSACQCSALAVWQMLSFTTPFPALPVQSVQALALRNVQMG